MLILGDSPRLNTGFARVNREAAKAFISAGWKVYAVPALTNQIPEGGIEDGIEYFAPQEGDDMTSRLSAAKVYEQIKPDIVYITGDPGLLVAYLAAMPQEAKIIGYIPIEGEPISNEFWRMAISNGNIITCSKYGADVVKKYLGKDIPWAYHGVDHNVFKKLDNREEIRKAIGWNDKFIITCVANNVRRKQIPRLVEAMSILRKKYKRNDTFLYLHTVPFQNHWLEGHNLVEIATMFGCGDAILFNTKMRKLHDGIEESTGDPKNPGLVEIYNASDLFVLPSQVEGFGLPIAEAMACGLPVMVTRYAAGWEVASPAGKGIPVHDWEIHKSGTMYANVSPEVMADEINRLIKNPKELARMSALGLERVADYNWNDFHEKLIEMAGRLNNADA